MPLLRRRVYGPSNWTRLDRPSYTKQLCRVRPTVGWNTLGPALDWACGAGWSVLDGACGAGLSVLDWACGAWLSVLDWACGAG
eukprot:gene7265-biopygen250